jgi:hypothetical protein
MDPTQLNDQTSYYCNFIYSKFIFRVFSKEELAKYDGSAGSPGIHLALLGVVSDSSNIFAYFFYL